MAKPRVHEIAAELGIDSKKALEKLKEMGEFVKGPSSSIEPPVARKLKAALEAEGITAPKAAETKVAEKRAPVDKPSAGQTASTTARPQESTLPSAETSASAQVPTQTDQPSDRPTETKPTQVPSEVKSGPKPGIPRPGNNPYTSSQGMPRPGGPRPGNNPFASTQGMQSRQGSPSGIPRPGAPRPGAPRAGGGPRNGAPTGTRTGAPGGGRGPGARTGGFRSGGSAEAPAGFGAPPRPGAGGRGRGGGTAGAFGRGSGKSKARKSKRTKRAEFELRDAPTLGGVTVPKGDGNTVIRLRRGASITDFADKIDASPANLVTVLFHLGELATATESLDEATFEVLGAELGYKIQIVSPEDEDRELLEGFDIDLDQEAEDEEDEDRVARPPVVTVMGHVDHGKTRLLDAIRKANVREGEAGGITQHIGAYQVRIGDQRITFIDTPGHAAFTTMRARGAQVTDIVVLVVAANDGIMPQTIEAIDHAKAAEVPIIVAVNKVDLPDANPQIVRQRLMEHGLVPEDFGGETICVDVSATRGTNLDKLLEMIALQAEVLELRGDPEKRAHGVVLEAELDRGRGPVATVLVQDGTLRRGDILVVGTCFGRVRLMENEHGQKLDEAEPSTPVRVIGLSGVPEAGQVFHVVETERAGREVVDHRLAQLRGRTEAARPKLSLEDIFAQAQGGGVKELSIVLKADVQGSVEAVRDALVKQSTDSVKVNVIHTGVGAITESDVMLAKASGAIVVGFHVRPDPAARRAAEGQGVDVRLYQIIYEATDDVRRAMVGLLPPTVKEVQLGRAEVRRTFTVPKIGTIAGSYILDGLIRRGAQCRLVRDGVQIFDGRVGSLKRFKDDAREVQSGFECGIGIDGYNDLKVGDVIEAYAREEQPATLD